jgi:hypothetical protein
MELPKIPAETTPFLWGALAGAIALAIVGFNWGGWVTGGNADKLAEARAEKAVVTALTPVCVHQFRKAANAPATLKTLNALSSWEQGDFVRKGGWATMPGGEPGEPNAAVVSACVDALNKPAL